MALSNDLITQLAKITNDKSDTKKETIVYGKAIRDGDMVYVQIDGAPSDMWTPVNTSATINSEDKENAERVTVMIKDHTATIIGNTSTPAASSTDVKEQGKRLDEFDILVSYKVTTDELSAIDATIKNLKAITAKYEEMTAVIAKIETLEAKFANLTYVNADTVTALNAEIQSIKAMFGDFTEITTDDLTAANAEIDNLVGYTAEFTYLSTEMLHAIKAEIGQLDANKLNANFANIDYANIDKAVFDEFYSKSGLIENVTAEDATVTGYLVGVTIKGDLIEAGTLVADQLVILGEDGLYYKLNTNGVTTEAEQTEYNSLNGSVITAKSITAEKVSVSDLVAFGATIGGFHITDGAIYSGVKESVDNSTEGMHIASDGQFSFGDSDNYIRYHKVTDEEGNEFFKLEISAESVLFGSGSKSSAADLKERMDHIYVGSYIDPATGKEIPCVELYETGEEEETENVREFRLRLTNKTASFIDGVSDTTIDPDGVVSDNLTARNELRHGPFAWTMRKNGTRKNYGLMWKGVVS